ncbi:MAG: hypothetical protein KGJ06_04870 [Pseudomonadota bacterium]|nr:hypothetical protein [Pseudomonadota bacterium]
MAKNARTLHIAGFDENADNKDIGCTCCLAEVCLPGQDGYWKYSERDPIGAAHCVYSRAELEENGCVTFIPDEARIEIKEGQSILAVLARKKFLAAAGLDAPPASFKGSDIQWIQLSQDNDPCYVTFLPRKLGIELQDHWAEALLKRTVEVAEKAKEDDQLIPLKEIARLSKLGLQAAHNADLRYQFNLRCLMKDRFMPEPDAPAAYKNIKEMMMPGEFPHVTGKEIDEDVANLHHSQGTLTTVPATRNLQPTASARAM